jgi:hypothetical protein
MYSACGSVVGWSKKACLSSAENSAKRRIGASLLLGHIVAYALFGVLESTGLSFR